MATRSSIPAWKIPWTEEPGGLQSMGLQRVRHDWAHTHRFPLFSASFSLVLCTVNFCCLVPWIQFHHSSVSDGFCLGLSFLCSSHKLGVIVRLIFFFNLLCLGDCCLPLPDIQSPENHYLMYFVWLKQFFKGGMVNQVSVILSWLAVEILFSYIFSVFISFKYFLHLKFILLWGHGIAFIYFFRWLPNTVYLFNIRLDFSSLSCVEFLYVAGLFQNFCSVVYISIGY